MRTGLTTDLPSDRPDTRNEEHGNSSSGVSPGWVGGRLIESIILLPPRAVVLIWEDIEVHSPMPWPFAIPCFLGAALCLIWGVTTEYRQSREDGPVAMVATLPFGVAAALLGTMGAAVVAGRSLPLWTYAAIFTILAAIFCFLITSASAPRS